MADEGDAQRSYAATPRRLEQARAAGQVARSRELATAAIILAVALGLSALGPTLFERCQMLMKNGLILDRGAVFHDEAMSASLSTFSVDIVTSIVPLLALVLIATFAGPLLLSGWVFSFKAMRPNFARLNPVTGLKQVISGNGLVELGKALAKSLLLGGIGAWAIWHGWDELKALAAENTPSAVAHLGALVAAGFFACVGGLVVIALIDAPYQLWRHHRALKMTREEIRQEQREQEGDPQLKARIRAQQRAVAKKRMMAAVPKAQVIVTNPTHYAVALEYRESAMRAPRVVAKGSNLIAQRIREIGEAHAVPLLEAPPLARALYRHADIGSEIPQALYTAVAQVLAYVHQVRRYRSMGGVAPVAPRELPVPADLDPAPLAQGTA